MTPSITEIPSSTNAREEKSTKAKVHDPKVIEWLKKGTGTEGINVNENNNKNNKNNNNNITNITITNNVDISSKEITNESNESFQENLEDTFVEDNFRAASSIGSSSTSRTGTPSSPYSAELVRTSHGSVDSISSSENEMKSSPIIKPLKAMTTTNTSFRNSNNNIIITNGDDASNVYEILQEIKPDHPLTIHTQFEFATTSSRLSSVSHNPLHHHHRNSSHPSRNSSNFSYNSSSRVPSPRNTINSYRRYSNFQISSPSRSFYNNNNNCYFYNNNSFNNFNNRNSFVNNNNQEKNFLYNEKNDDCYYYNHYKKSTLIKYIFWFGFLFIPIWWLGSFYKPTSTEDHKWRKCCRRASFWSFILLVVTIIVIIIVKVRHGSGI